MVSRLRDKGFRTKLMVVPTDYGLVLKKLEQPSVEGFQQWVEERAKGPICRWRRSTNWLTMRGAPMNASFAFSLEETKQDDCKYRPPAVRLLCDLYR